MSDRIKWIWGCWLIILLWSAAVCTADEAAYQLDSVTVTAEKREENVQDIPSAISVLTETEIEDAGIETIIDVVDMIPNMTVNEGMGGYNEIVIRGIGASMFTGKIRWCFMWTAFLSTSQCTSTWNCSISSGSKCFAAPRARYTERTPSAG